MCLSNIWLDRLVDFGEGGLWKIRLKSKGRCFERDAAMQPKGNRLSF